MAKSVVQQKWDKESQRKAEHNKRKPKNRGCIQKLLKSTSTNKKKQDGMQKHPIQVRSSKSKFRCKQREIQQTQETIIYSQKQGQDNICHPQQNSLKLQGQEQKMGKAILVKQLRRRRRQQNNLFQDLSKKHHNQLDCIYGYSIDESECSDDEFDQFVKSLPPLDSVVPRFRAQMLPKKTRSIINKKTLVLDLDETLIHSSLKPQEVVNPDVEFQINASRTFHVYVKFRPYMQKFLEHISQIFEVVVFTASLRIYGEPLLNFIDPQRSLVKHRLYRDSCVCIEQCYIKDISVLGRDLSDIIIVDNNPQSFGFQIDNGIPIVSFYGDQKDDALLKLLPLLELLSCLKDVREAIAYKFRLKTLCKSLQG